MAVRIVEVELHYICGGQLAVNVMHFQGDTAVADMFQVAKSVVETLDGTIGAGPLVFQDFLDPQSNRSYGSALVARVVGSFPGSKYPKLYASGQFTGTIDEPIYSQQVAANLQLITASGPDYSGRVNLPGIAETTILRNRWTASQITLLNALRDKILLGFLVGAVQFDPVVYNRTTMTAEVVTNIQLKPNPSTIRRRLSPY